ncbi:hypothetical protein [Sphaerotilus sp.]|nr:hypothetical protein [Sphaerotilus sp.]
MSWSGLPDAVRTVELQIALKRHESAERSTEADPRRDWDLRPLVEQA